MKSKFWIIGVIFFNAYSVFGQSFYQKRSYFDLGTGNAGYFGDLSPRNNPFKNQSLVGSSSFGYSLELNPFIWLRASYSLLNIKAQDIDSKYEFENTRNLHFLNNLHEFSLSANFDLLGEKHYFKEGKIKPYFSLGMALFYSNPFARLPKNFGGIGNKFVELRNVGTEGQNIGVKNKYALWNLAMPIGFGFDFKLGKSLFLSTEFAWRIAFTDYIDDVSGKYVDLRKFEKNSISAALSDRSAEPTGGFYEVLRKPKLPSHTYEDFTTYSGFSHPQNPNNRRGDKIPFDSYNSLQLRLRYKLPLSKRQRIPKHDFPFTSEIEAPEWIYLPRISERFEIELARINTKHSEIACTFVSNHLLFLSDVPRTRFFKPKFFHKYYHRYYMTPLADVNRNELTKALSFVDKKDEAKDYFTASYYEAENQLYFGAYNNFKSNAVESIYQSFIFESRLISKSKKIDLGGFVGEVSEPFVSADGYSIYFTVFDPVTKSDIYVAFKDSSGWSHPIRLPHPINTEHNEIHPTVHRDGTLYFSSDRPGAFGGFDIYEAVIVDIMNPEVALLPTPINSLGNDFGLLLDNYKRFGFFTSSRAGGVGEEDIYTLRVNQLSKTSRLLSDTMNLQKSQELVLIGQITSNDGAPVSGAVVKKLDILNDAVDITYTDTYGLYSFLLTNDSDYKIGASAQGYEPSSDTLIATVTLDFNKPQIDLNITLKERVVISKLFGHLISKGEPISGARVFLKDLKSESIQETATLASGFYEFQFNSKHPHLILVQANGFKPVSFKINGSSSEFAENLRYNISMERISD